MTKAIFYKEWLKTRLYYTLAFTISALATLWTILRIARVARMRGVEHLWEILLSRDVVFIETLQYLPLAAGLVLAVVQFAPEMAQKRLKLTLHLPCQWQRTVLGMTLFGAAMLLSMFLLQGAALWIYLRTILAPELVWRMLMTAAPWFVCGLAAYFLVSWICLEPTWKRRIADVLIAVGVISVCFMAPAPQAYDSFLPMLAAFTALTLFFPLVSVWRFRAGKQD